MAGKNGGARPGAGRKPLKVEDNVKLAIKKAMSSDPAVLTRIWEKVFEKAEKGSERHIQILFNYYYGKPIESVIVNSKAMVLKRIIINEEIKTDKP